MAQWKTHYAFEAAAGVLAVGGLVVLKLAGQLSRGVLWEEIVAFAVGYGFSMLLLSPDLDLRKNKAAERWGPLRVIWAPYYMLFRHRGISHSMLWGTATRLVYLTLVALLAGVLFSALWGLLGVEGLRNFRPQGLLEWMGRNIELTVWFIAGCYLPNIIHVLVDRFT